MALGISRCSLNVQWRKKTWLKQHVLTISVAEFQAMTSALQAVQIDGVNLWWCGDTIFFSLKSASGACVACIKCHLSCYGLRRAPGLWSLKHTLPPTRSICYHETQLKLDGAFKWICSEPLILCLGKPRLGPPLSCGVCRFFLLCLLGNKRSEFPQVKEDENQQSPISLWGTG